MEIEKLGLSVEQTEFLYNLEYYKALNDIQATDLPINNDGIKKLKKAWLDEWKTYITDGFSSFLGNKGAILHWYSKQDLIVRIEENEPWKTWFRLVLLEVMLFEPYFPLSTEKDKDGTFALSQKYFPLKIPACGFSANVGDTYLDSFFNSYYYHPGYIKRLRSSYNRVAFEMKEVFKGILISGAVTAGVTILVVLTAGVFAGPIAVALVGSNFVGLNGAALTSACLAYLGGGAIAAGGAGMVGGTAVVVGGGAILGLGTGAGVREVAGYVSLLGKENTILQSSKLIVSIREIFLDDEKDIEYSNTVYEQYVQNIVDIENGLTELRIKADIADGKEKKELKRQIKNAEESVKAMKIARKCMLKYKTLFENGLT